VHHSLTLSLSLLSSRFTISLFWYSSFSHPPCLSPLLNPPPKNKHPFSLNYSIVYYILSIEWCIVFIGHGYLGTRIRYASYLLSQKSTSSLSSWHSSHREVYCCWNWYYGYIQNNNNTDDTKINGTLLLYSTFTPTQTLNTQTLTSLVMFPMGQIVIIIM